MKKLIQILSLASLLVVFSATAAFAQNDLGSDVNIPFAFNVDDRSYEAGNYIVKLQRRISGTATLSIHNTKTDEMQSVIVNVGGSAPSGKFELIFDSIDGRRYLTKVSTADRTYALIKSKAVKMAEKARNSAKPVETATVGGASSLF